MSQRSHAGVSLHIVRSRYYDVFIMSVEKVVLPDKLNELAKARASERGCKNLEDYVRLLIREDSPGPIDARLEAELLQSLRSPARKTTRQFWSEKRRKLLQSHRRAKAG